MRLKMEIFNFNTLFIMLHGNISHLIFLFILFFMESFQLLYVSFKYFIYFVCLNCFPLKYIANKCISYFETNNTAILQKDISIIKYVSIKQWLIDFNLVTDWKRSVALQFCRYNRVNILIEIAAVVYENK